MPVLWTPTAALAAMSDGLRRSERITVTYEKSLRRIVTESGGEIDLQAQAGVSALRVAFRNERSVERHKKIVLERGTWIDGRLRPLEVYQDDKAFTPGTDRTMASMVQEIHDAMGDVVQQAFVAVLTDVREGVETLVAMGRSVLRVDAEAGQNLRQVGAVVWSWWGPDPSARPSALSAPSYAARAKIVATAQAAARLEYGIGGFYQLTPAGEVLTAPADLTIGYADDEVAGIDEQALAVYTFDPEAGQWLLVGGTVNAADNTVTVPVSVLGVYTLAPRIPSGGFGLQLQGDALPADGHSRIAVVSDTVWNNDGTPVPDGTPFDVWTTGGSVITADVDPLRDGRQIRTAGPRLHFEIQAGNVASPAQVVARSVAGTASGRTPLLFTDASPPLPPQQLQAEMQDDQVLMTWAASAAPDLAGYRIYYKEGEPGPPYDGVAAPPGQPSPVAVGVGTSVRLAGLRPAQTYHFALTAYDVLGNESALSPEAILFTDITAVWETAVTVPVDFQLYAAYPNPFNAATTLHFDMPVRGHLRLAIYNVAGQLVRELVLAEVAAGSHSVGWDARDAAGRPVASGVYLAVLEAADRRQVQRMALLR